MKKLCLIVSLLLFAFSLEAQLRTGNIYGTIVDTEGNPLPGVSVTLTGPTIAPLTAVTTAEGRFRFLSLPPGKEYTIKAELQGFKTRVESGVIVSVGTNTEIRIVMEVGRIEEEVTVTATVPIVDTKKTTITHSVNYEMLQSLPTARDPWVILQTAPGILVDRENIGGNESGQQSGYVSKGSSGFTDWNLDGVRISDPAATGASPTYYDFDVFDEINIVTSGHDVESQVGGVNINLVTRRGGNRVSLGGRFYLTDEKFQNKLSQDEIAKLGVMGYNRIIEIKDFGFNIGGPFIKDKFWWWGSYGVQEIKTTMITGTRDDTYLNNLSAKINFQLIPENRAEFFVHAGKKEKFGRSASTDFPPGWYQRGKYHFGSPIFKIQDEHMFGNNLFLSVKYGFTDAGFGMSPMNDVELKNMAYYNVEKVLWENSQWWFFSGRPHHYLQGQAIYYNDNLLGASHEVKFGVEYDYRGQDYVSGYPGNMYVDYSFNYPIVDWNGDGRVDIPKTDFGIDLKLLHLLNGVGGEYLSHGYAAYLSDTITYKRLTLKLGFRFDRQKAWLGEFISYRIFTEDMDHPDMKNYYEIVQANTTPGTAEKLAAVYPRVKAPSRDPKHYWDVLSPRLGLTFDVFGDGKTIAKLSGAIFGEFMSTWQAWMWAYGGLWGWMDFWWYDANKDNKIDWKELYWANANTYVPYRAWNDAGQFVGNWDREAGYMWGDFDWKNPTKLEEPYYTVDPEWKSQRVREVVFSLEREISTDVGIALDLTYRIYDRFHTEFWYWPETGKILNSKDFYMVAGTVPASFVDKATGKTYSAEQAAGKPWYVLKPDVTYTPYRYYTNWNTDRKNVYYGLDFRFIKRLSNRWMLNGSFSLQNQVQYYGEKGYADPTNIWALDGQIYAPSLGGGSGKLSQPAFSRWLVKLSGLYQLPLDFNVSMTLFGRQGFIIPATVTLVDNRLPNPLSRRNTIYIRPYGTGERLPNMWYANLRVEKMIPFGERGKAYLTADVFNVFNAHTMNRRRAIFLGTYYVDSDRFVPYPRSGEPNEILNPRVVRFGLRFEF